MLADGIGGQIHRDSAIVGWLVPSRNPFGLYLYREDVDGLAVLFSGEILGDGDPSDKPPLNAPDDLRHDGSSLVQSASVNPPGMRALEKAPSRVTEIAGSPLCAAASVNAVACPTRRRNASARRRGVPSLGECRL
jgi:hypothetical protein